MKITMTPPVLSIPPTQPTDTTSQPPHPALSLTPPYRASRVNSRDASISFFLLLNFISYIWVGNWDNLIQLCILIIIDSTFVQLLIVWQTSSLFPSRCSIINIINETYWFKLLQNTFPANLNSKFCSEFVVSLGIKKKNWTLCALRRDIISSIGNTFLNISSLNKVKQGKLMITEKNDKNLYLSLILKFL